LSEPFGDAALAKNMLAGQLDWGVEVCQADGAIAGGILRWYQTSGEEAGARRKRHDSFLLALTEVCVLTLSLFVYPGSQDRKCLTFCMRWVGTRVLICRRLHNVFFVHV
jgi:hypothetical protein